MARIKIETPVPAGTEVSDAIIAARLQAADMLKIQIVEQTLLPIDPNSPNDHTVDRTLVTHWDHIGGNGGGQ